LELFSYVREGSTPHEIWATSSNLRKNRSTFKPAINERVKNPYGLSQLFEPEAKNNNPAFIKIKEMAPIRRLTTGRK